MTRKRIVILDTSILCVWLGLTEMKKCTIDNVVWSKDSIDKEISKELKLNSNLVLPIAVLIETGNHIAQSKHNRYELVRSLSNLIDKCVDEDSNWIVFTTNSEFCTDEGLLKLASNLPELFKQNVSIGDASIKNVAEFYSERGYEVEIFTCDHQLEAYQPSKPTLVPRRRK